MQYVGTMMLMIGKVCKHSYFSILNVLVFQEGLNLLVYFNFCFFILGSSERFDSLVNFPSFLLICAIAPLITCFDLKSKTIFSKITTYLSYNCISVFMILLQLFFLFSFLSVFCNSISVKFLMISCLQTLV